MQESCPKSSKTETLGRMLATYGDVDPITHGGGRVFDSEYGPFLEYTRGTEDEGDDLEVYRVNLEEDILDQFSNLLDDKNIVDMCTTIDASPALWKKHARGTLVQRANCIVDIANYLGWENIDEDPLIMNEVELQLRWYQAFDHEGPCTTEDAEPTTTVPELLLLLQAVNAKKYASVFSGAFPLLPSAAIQNPNSDWWREHGKEVESRIVELLAGCSPPGFVFNKYEGQFGFWAIQDLSVQKS